MLNNTQQTTYKAIMNSDTYVPAYILMVVTIYRVGLK